MNHINTVRDFYTAAVNRADMSGLPIDPQIEWIEPDVPDLWLSGTHRGLDAVRSEVIEPTFEQFDDFRVRCEQFLDAGDHVVVLGRFEGRAKQTGIELNAPFAHVWTFRGDRAVKFQNYMDTADWLYALYRLHVEHPVGV